MDSTRIVAAARPYILITANETVIPLTADEAQRIIDAYAPLTVTATCYRFADRGGVFVHAIRPATLDSNPAFWRQGDREALR